MATSEQPKAESATSAERQQMSASFGVQTSNACLSLAVNSRKTPAEDHVLKENADLSSSGNHNGPQADQPMPSVLDETSPMPAVSTSGSGLASVAQGHTGYAVYSNSDPYGYSSADYAAYYGQYQQQVQYQQPDPYQQHPAQYHQQPSSYPHQTDQSYPQQLGVCQNTGASYQAVTSFQNTGTYGEPASYSSTYYNHGDYQTSGSYASAPYSSQTNFWPGAQYANYNAHQYSNYTPDPHPAYGSTTAVAPSQYQQQYKQWNGYYSQSPTEAICAPGTENIHVSASSTANGFVSGGNGSAFSQSNQNPSVYNPHWRPESSSAASTSSQVDSSSGNAPESYWNYFAPNTQNNLLNSVPPLGQKTSELTLPYESSKIPHNISYAHGSAVLDTSGYQGAQNQHSNSHAVPQPPELLDPRKACKVQIPTNPRIASNLPVTLPRCEKDSVKPIMTSRPAYVSVKAGKPSEKVVSHEEAESMLKTGTFPTSLRGYVERALSRCKNDRQKLASQAIMKEVITRATAEGTLHTRDWDVEPLFPLPNDDIVNDTNGPFLVPDFLIQKSKSPRRPKSRWEPIQEEKKVGTPANGSYASSGYGFWNSSQLSGGLTENKGDLGTKYSLTDQESFRKNAARPAKRQRVNDDLNVTNDNGSSSDSDKEQNLTKYYAAAIALADTPEEKRRRENRSKRFERGHSKQSQESLGKKNGVASNSGHFHARRASALVLSRSFEESGSRAVEDIDWDALIIKGTCQEIEKRYLRLTSAPDPATVRPEDVLEKALSMVQNSPKNYLYKCDQLKSIRQDLTVQHIRNEFTAKVYETHARFAIEAGDLPEYNQCQSQLKTLYAEGIIGCHMEFAAYNLLSVILHSNNNRDLLSAMSRLSELAKEDEAVKHALSVRAAVTAGNYVMFFKLYNSAPNLNALFMDLYAEKMRYAAVKCMSRSYRPTVPVSYLSQILGFRNTPPTNDTCMDDKADGLEECTEWLKAHGACIIREASGEVLLDTKVSVSSLYMPDPEDAVSHGDTNLAVNDFLTRSSA